jgi:hypothetical protein
MSTESTILLSSTSTTTWDGASGIAYTFSEKSKGAGYHRKNGGLHTVMFELDQFKGSIKLQGSLELYPGDNDWTDIIFDNSAENLESIDSTPLVTNEIRNFTGNFVWIRLGYRLIEGTITQVRYNY